MELHDDVDAWFVKLCEQDPQSADLVEEAIDHLVREGPPVEASPGRSDQGSRHHNMKELRPASAGRSEVRILFAFDPQRHAILLVAGDKSGSWRGWYERNIPVADQRFDEHLAELDERKRRH